MRRPRVPVGLRISAGPGVGVGTILSPGSPPGVRLMPGVRSGSSLPIPGVREPRKSGVGLGVGMISGVGGTAEASPPAAAGASAGE